MRPPATENVRPRISKIMVTEGTCRGIPAITATAPVCREPPGNSTALAGMA